MIVVALIGMPGSGKGVASELFKESGFEIYYMNSVLKEEIAKRNIEYSVDNVGMVANELRELEGMAAVAKRLAPKIVSEKSCVEGVRSNYELDAFRKLFENLVVVALDCRLEVRYERVKGRGRTDDVQSYEEFLKKDEREAGWGVKAGIEEAEYRIDNNGSIAELKNQVQKAIEDIQAKDFK
ncbi:AAA family ATPase [Candidatus Undinarchaeota archaeon]